MYILPRGEQKCFTRKRVRVADGQRKCCLLDRSASTTEMETFAPVARPLRHRPHTNVRARNVRGRRRYGPTPVRPHAEISVTARVSPSTDRCCRSGPVLLPLNLVKPKRKTFAFCVIVAVFVIAAAFNTYGCLYVSRSCVCVRKDGGDSRSYAFSVDRHFGVRVLMTPTITDATGRLGIFRVAY